MSKELVIPENFKYIAAFLTMKCNLHCSYCHNTFSQDFNRKKFKEISGKDWVSALDRLVSRPDLPVTLEGGEPSLHPDFIYIIRHLKPELNLHLLTNLQWGNKKVGEFISQVNPEKFKANRGYHAIRVSYHPEQMGDGENLVANTRRMKDAGFDMGIEAVMYPSPEQLAAIDQMEILCGNSGINFRVKMFTGVYEGQDDFGIKFVIRHGNFSKYPDSVFQQRTKTRLCRIPELYINTDARVYRCHHDMLLEHESLGSLLNNNFEIDYSFKVCHNYGQCHPCDVKSKPDSRRKISQTSAEIKDIE